MSARRAAHHHADLHDERNQMKTTDEVLDIESPVTAARRAVNRRGFLWGSAAVGGLGLIAAACGDDDGGNGGSTGGGDGGTTPSTEGGGGGGDLAVAMTAASLEVLAVSTYTMAGEAATSGALGEVPPVVVEYVTTATEHHQAALDAWNGVITGAGEAEVTEPPSDLAATVEEQFGMVTDVVGAAELALSLESTAAATYLAALPSLTDPAAIELAAGIAVVDRQHIALLNFALGEYPIPEVFASTEEAVA